MATSKPCITAYKLVQVRPAPDAAYEPRACARISICLTGTFFQHSKVIVNASHAHFTARPMDAEHAARVEEIYDIYEPSRKYDSALSILNPCIEYRVNETFHGRRVSFVLSPDAVYSIEFKKNKGKHTFERIDFPLVNENLRIVYRPNGMLKEIVEFDRATRTECGFFVVNSCNGCADFAYPPNGGIANLLRRHEAGELGHDFLTLEIVAAQQKYYELEHAIVNANDLHAQ